MEQFFTKKSIFEPRVPYRTLLAITTILFAIRIIIQPLVAKFPVDWLPPFETWHSEAMPYVNLLFLQVIILGIMGLGTWFVPRLDSNQKTSRVFAAIGGIYLLLMVIRMFTGVFDLSEHMWFDGAIPTVFHFVLIAYLIVVSHSFSDLASRIAFKRLFRFCGYPFIILVSLTSFVWMMNSGSPLLFSSYLSVLLGTLGVILHESLHPARSEWSPTAEDLIPDGLFLIIVQVGIPSVLKVVLPAVIITLAGNSAFTKLNFWPHGWPLIGQVGLMLLTAEFFRYWIHRFMHEFNGLWKFHAVHHASDKLYTMNVGRFHPLDKTIQFLGDSLPFLLLGVSSEIFAAYFVFYAINGFYQHSNADVKLCFLNWIVAGPELHRWHHSTTIAEGHANYGNNLIIWDSFFGTRFLPPERTVSEVGIGNKQWPKGFFSQIIAPLTHPTDQESDT